MGVAYSCFSDFNRLLAGYDLFFLNFPGYSFGTRKIEHKRTYGGFSAESLNVLFIDRGRVVDFYPTCFDIVCAFTAQYRYRATVLVYCCVCIAVACNAPGLCTSWVVCNEIQSHAVNASFNPPGSILPTGNWIIYHDKRAYKRRLEYFMDHA